MNHWEAMRLTCNGVKYDVVGVETEFGAGCHPVTRFECINGKYLGYGDDFAIERVIHNEPATVVLWKDGTKTVVKCSEGDEYDPEKGLLLCIAKKAYGNKGRFNDVLREHVPPEPVAFYNFAESINETVTRAAQRIADTLGKKRDTFDWDAFKRGETAARCETLEAALEFNEEAKKHGIHPFLRSVVERSHAEGASYEAGLFGGLHSFDVNGDASLYNRRIRENAKTVDYPAKDV